MRLCGPCDLSVLLTKVLRTGRNVITSPVNQLTLPPVHCTPSEPAVALAYEEPPPFSAVPPTLEQEENRIGDKPTQIRRSSAVLFIVLV